MNERAQSLEGMYFDGVHPIGVPATLLIGREEVILVGAEVSQRYRRSRLQVSAPSGCADRFVALPDGGQFQSPDTPLLDTLPQEVRSEGVVAWLEQRTTVAVVAIVLIFGLALAGYFYGLPAAAARVAKSIPPETEQALGEQALIWLEETNWFEASKTEPEILEEIRRGFDGLLEGLPTHGQYRLEFRNAPKIGPNAFALPGGTIVMTDQLIQQSEALNEVLAILAHEVGHVEKRHAIRLILQDSAVVVAITAITADAASLSVAVSGLPALLAQAKYSRAFETEADEFAFGLLGRQGIPPDAFANILERIAAGHGKREAALSFVSSHPLTEERVRRARAASQ